jgi:hypothetical protein
LTLKLLEAFSKRTTIDARLLSQDRVSAIRTLKASWYVPTHIVTHSLLLPEGLSTIRCNIVLESDIAMSRKQAEKSNVHIGIFSGKSMSYNLAVLETLFQKQATAWQIAVTLQKKINPNGEKEVRYYRAQKIYSVIQRKSGRLADLKSKGYINATNGKWKLTRKGLIALNIKKPDLVASGLQASKDTLTTMFKGYIDDLPNETTIEPLGIQIDLSKIKPFLEELDPTSMLIMILEETRFLLSRGIELDSISEKDLLDIVMGRAISQGERIIDEAKKKDPSSAR